MAAAVCPTAYSWADNAQGLDPCAVASQLLSVCSPDAVLPSISAFEVYPPPTPQTECSCSSPVYALVSACADCQSAFFSNWKDWSHGCPETFISNFPKAEPASIPEWATFDVTLQHTYNRELAENIAQAQAPPASPTSTPDSAPSFPASTAAATVSDTIDPASSSVTPDVASSTGSDGASNTAPNTASPATTVPTTPTTATDASASSLNAAYSADVANGSTAPEASQSTSLSGQANSLESTNKKSSNKGAIAGGTIGGLILLVILGGILFWWIARRRRSRTAPSAAYIAALRPPTSLSARPLGERFNSALESGDLNAAYHDEEKYETSYPVDRKGPRYTHLPRESSPGVYGSS